MTIAINIWELPPSDMEKQLDGFATEQLPLQAWISQCTWIPVFDRAGSYERTAYEDASVLNWFRGITGDGGGLNDKKMTALWCGNVLRMVTPRLWLCRHLRLNLIFLSRACVLHAGAAKSDSGRSTYVGTSHFVF